MTAAPPPISYAATNVRPKLNAISVAALITGIVSILIPIFFPVAITLGVIGMMQAKKHHQRGFGFAVAGLACGIVGMISGGLMGIALYTARLRAQQVTSAANLRSIGQSLVMYSVENRGWLPADLPTLALSQKALASNSAMFVRPGTTDTPAAAPGTPPANWAATLTPGSGFCSYTYVLAAPTKINTIRRPSQYVLLYETAPPAGRPVNVLFADGHVEFIAPAIWAPKLAALKTGTNPPP